LRLPGYRHWNGALANKRAFEGEPAARRSAEKQTKQHGHICGDLRLLRPNLVLTAITFRLETVVRQGPKGETRLGGGRNGRTGDIVGRRHG
jgi:hypothetical protein